MIFPKFIKKEETIGVPAPSAGSYDEIDIKRFKNAKNNMENLGFNISLSKNIFKCEKSRSASTLDRANEINKMIENNDINTILCAAGGEFLVEILPYIDFAKIAKNPKWIEGFSDPTGLLFPITTKYDIATIYGNNFKSFGVEKFDESMKNNLEILKGNLVEQTNFDMYENERIERVTGLEGYKLTDKVEWKTLSGKPEKFTGRIIGGCIDIISELAGTRYDGVAVYNVNCNIAQNNKINRADQNNKEINWKNEENERLSFGERYKDDGIIWYFDNCELSKEELIRTLWKFNELGYFKYCKGIIFGRNGTEIESLNYTSMSETLKDSSIGKLNIPIIYDADISHKGPSMTIINGAIATVECKYGKGRIKLCLDYIRSMNQQEINLKQ